MIQDFDESLRYNEKNQGKLPKETVMEKVGHKGLQEIKGIGSVLAQRLVEAGYDSFARVAQAGEDGLRNIRGLNPRAIPSILEQAQILDGESVAGADERLLLLQNTSGLLQVRIRELAAAIRERQGDKLSGKKGERLEKEVTKLLKGLEKVQTQKGIRIKRARKGLAKTGKRLEGLTEGGIKSLTRGLKKARKPLKRI
jgi:ribosomal protein S13